MVKKDGFEWKRYNLICRAEEYADEVVGSQPQGYGAEWWGLEWSRVFRGRMFFFFRQAGLIN